MKSELLRLSKKWLLWIFLFAITSFHYYQRFFSYWESFLLVIVLLAHVTGMFFVGYFLLSKRKRFPWLPFLFWLIGFSISRWLVIYFILQHSLPSFTVFHYPQRAIFFVIITTAIFIFFGYSFAIYQWGLAARDRFRMKSNNERIEFQLPFVLRTGGKNVYIIPDDIMYLQANGEYVKYITTQGNYLCFERLKTAQENLSVYGFIRVHRSFIINPKHILSYSSSEIITRDNYNIPISKTYRESLFDVLSKK